MDINIETANIVIAKFMGATIAGTAVPPNVLIIGLNKDYPKNSIRPNELCYHKDWNWIMGVYAKISDEGFGFPEEKENVLWSEYNNIMDALLKVDIKKTHEYIYAFIEEYNK